MNKPDLNDFYSQPILNSPYEELTRHWELDAKNQLTRHIMEQRRPADFITPVPKSKKQTGAKQGFLMADATDMQAARISDPKQEYQKALINEIRGHVSACRQLPKAQWKVTPITARLLEHGRTRPFGAIRPFFC